MDFSSQGSRKHAQLSRTIKMVNLCDCHPVKSPFFASPPPPIELDESFFSFFRHYHLHVHTTEQTFKYKGMTGRVDAIFGQFHTNNIFVIDWKFKTHFPRHLSNSVILQLNCYRYLMGHDVAFNGKEINLYCCVFVGKLCKFYKCPVLNRLFFKQLITSLKYI